ncbi:MAG: phosphoribosylformylglycinamidine synthase I [Chloroflexota bacterium]
MKPSILILHASGTNRDEEAAWACEIAGGAPEIIHITQLRCGERQATEFDMLLIPGGFSYGDALGAGSRLALDVQLYLDEALNHFIEQKKPVLGICNGFQVLVKAGLLPGWKVSAQQPRRVTLTANERAQFECRWVHLAVDPSCQAELLHTMTEPIFCPVAHGEGNLQVVDEDTLTKLKTEGLIAFRYARAEGQLANGQYPFNPNGSVYDIAGLCNAEGNVIGLMPHPEDHILPIQNPLGKSGQLGIQLFQAILGSMI